MQRLRELRTARGLLLKDVAKELGVDESTISNYERGTRLPRFQMANRLASFFNVPIEEIFPEYRRTSPYPKSISNCKV